MDILPILSTLKRHKTAAGLIVLQIALTCAIVCNALFLISERIEKIGAPSGIPETELLTLSVAGMTRTDNPDVQSREDLRLLRQIPGVRAAFLISQMPFGENFSASGVRLSNDRDARAVSAAQYKVSEGWFEGLGLRLAEGRDFTADEYIDDSIVSEKIDANVPAIIINKPLAERLFPGQSALGKPVWVLGEQPHRIVGVLEQLESPAPSARNEANLYTMALPARPNHRAGNYMLRTAPEQRDAVMKAAESALVDRSGSSVKRLLRDQQRLEDMRNDYYRQDRSMVWLLGSVCVGLLLVTAFGIVGLASFWVQQRTRMIGTRRALGATQGQILRYFQTENFLLSTIGIGLGMVGAYGISLALMQHYEMPRLPWSYLPIGALVLWALGQLAVLAPARRAAALPPVAALRGA